MSETPPIYKSLTFWTLLVGIGMFVVQFYVPAFPLTTVNILALVLFALGLIGVTPTFRVFGFQAAFEGGIVASLAFWQLVAGFVLFVFTYFSPTFPFTNEAIMGIILYILSFFRIKPEFQSSELLRSNPKKK